AALEALDQVHLPRRAVEVDVVAVQPRDQDAELALVAGRRQRRPPHVVLEIDAPVLDPRLQRVAQEVRRAEPQVPRRVHRDAGADLVHQRAHVVPRRVARRRERHHARDVHHHLARLSVQEHRVARRQVLAAHVPMLPYRAMTPLRSLVAAAALLAPAAAFAQVPAPPPPLPKIEVTASAVQLDGLPTLSTDLVFEIGEAAIQPAALPLLDAIAKALAANGSPRFLIHVYADDTAPDNDKSGVWLQKLTQRRADALKAHFLRRGVPARKLAATGHGSTSSVADNRTEAGKRANR